jgi:hypothetical protein
VSLVDLYNATAFDRHGMSTGAARSDDDESRTIYDEKPRRCDNEKIQNDKSIP